MKTIKIKGMSCNHCVMAVTRALKAVDGIQNVTVSLEAGQASFDESKSVDMKIVKEQVKKAGYDIE